MNLKKITALALGAVMAVSMAVPTFAADEVETVTDGKLTVATSRILHRMNSILSTRMVIRHWQDSTWIWQNILQTRWDWNWK